jgi:hypothetical protein
MIGLVLSFSLFVPATAHAQLCTSCFGDPQNPDDGFGGWDNLDPSGTLNPPTTTKCTAYASQNQGCRGCAEARYDNGQSKGYFVCAYVQASAACGCTNAGTANCQATNTTCTYSP